MGFIYKITNLINNKIYIGQTCKNESSRWQEHIWHAYNDPQNDAPYLCAAIKKYGRENFTHEILAEVEDKELNQKEKEYIALYNSTDRTIGYNIALGGDGHTKYDIDQIQFLYNKYKSIAEVARILKASPDTISKRLHGLGITTSNDTVYQYDLNGNLISIYNSYSEAKQITKLPLGHCIPNFHYSNGYFWIYEKDNLDINDVILQYKTNPNLKQVVQQYDLKCNFIQEYESCGAAAKATSINLSSLKAAANNKQVTAGGYIWYKPAEEQNLEDKYKKYLMSRSCCEIEEVDLEGNVLQKYPSAGVAETQLGWSYNSIKNVCDGKTKHTHGRIFRYSNPDKRKLLLSQRED